MFADDSSTRYHRLQLILGVISLATGLACLGAALWTGAADVMARHAGSASPALAWRVAVVAIVLGVGYRLVIFPLAFLRGYWLPRRYGLLHQSFAGWLGDRLKAAVVGGVLGLVAVQIVYGLMAMTAWWWLAAAAVLLAIQLVLAVVFPIWVVPLFYRLTPLADEELRSRLLSVAARAGVHAVGVWVADQSRKSRTANAALTGLGRTRRIVLFDTLIARFQADQIESVLAHELGHHVHRDMWRGFAVQAALTILSLWVAERMMGLGVRWLDLDGPTDPAGLPWLAFVIATVGFFATPLVNAFSRWMERQADDFALAMTGNVPAFVGAMESLASLNLAERRPNRLKELVLYSHPSIDRRIARALGRPARTAA